MTCKRPVIGIIGNSAFLGEDYPVHAGGTMNCEAIGRVADAVPMIIPSDPALVSVAELLELCDGFLLTGGRPNIHPEEYGEAETPAHGDFDRARDAMTLPLIRACVARGQPFLGTPAWAKLDGWLQDKLLAVQAAYPGAQLRFIDDDCGAAHALSAPHG